MQMKSVTRPAMRRRALPVAIAVAAALALAACGSSSSSSSSSSTSAASSGASSSSTSAASSTSHKNLTIALVPGLTVDPFYITMHAGAAEEAKKLGVNLTWQGGTTFSPTA